MPDLLLLLITFFGEQFSSTPRPLRERAEFQVELLRNLEIRVRGTSVGYTSYLPNKISCQNDNKMSCHPEERSELRILPITKDNEERCSDSEHKRLVCVSNA